MPPKTVPPVFNYAEQAKNQSMLNTPATYNWYLVGLGVEMVKRAGRRRGYRATQYRQSGEAVSGYRPVELCIAIRLKYMSVHE